MDGKLYLIKRSNENDNCGYYAEHGEMGGVPDGRYFCLCLGLTK